MKKFIKCLIAFLCILITTLVNIEKTNAASFSYSVSGGKAITIGSSVKVTVKTSYPGGGSASFSVSYDKSKLRLTGNPNDYYNNKLIIDFSQYNSGTATFTFSAIATGSAKVTVSLIQFVPFEPYGYTGNSVSTRSTTFTIKPKSTGSTSTSGPVKSSNALLSSLTVEGQELMPAFTSEVTEYAVYLPKDTTTLNITAKAEDEKAKVETISNTVKEGWNEIPIVCVAEDGSKKTYNLRAYVEEKPDVFYSFNGEQLGVVKNLDNADVFDGFEAADIEVKSAEEGSEEKNRITIFNWAVYNILFMENSQGTKAFYRYDRFKNEITGIFRFVNLANRRFVETDFSLEDFPALADSMEESEYTFEDGSKTKCLKYKDTRMREFFVFYVSNEQGQKLFYQLDSKENSLQRFFLPQTQENNKENDYTQYVYMGVGGLGLFSLLISMISVRRERKKAVNSF